MKNKYINKICSSTNHWNILRRVWR